MWRKELIERGSYWRIGNARNVRVYRDRWIPRPNTFVITSPPSLGTYTIVSKLITEDGLWDNRTITTHFNDIDVKAIFDICLESTAREDILV